MGHLMTRRAAILALLSAFLVLGACKRMPPKPAGGPLQVVVTVAPLKGIVEPLLPPGATVRILMQPGRSEHGYEFTPSDIAALTNADLVVYVGLGLEGRLEALLASQKAPDRQVISFAEAVEIKADDHHDHDHADHDEHDHAVDPHLWLDPALVDAFAPKLAEAVLKAQDIDPHLRDGEVRRVNETLKSHRDRIREVDQKWRTALEPFKGASIVTHHNAFPRPAERYSLKIAAVVREFEADPTPGDLQKVVEAIMAQNVQVIFVEPQYNAAAVEKIRDLAGVRVAQIDPLGDGDWFALMQHNLDALVNGLSGIAPTAPANQSNK
jgi:zinc transport system substrate-binding protein